jgi:hypothetical protein
MIYEIERHRWHVAGKTKTADLTRADAGDSLRVEQPLLITVAAVHAL